MRDNKNCCTTILASAHALGLNKALGEAHTVTVAGLLLLLLLWLLLPGATLAGVLLYQPW